jgi:YbbR domain-containing protein
VPVHADLRAELLVTIFYRGTALHDGAVVVSGEKITSAGVLLPLSQNVLDSERYGTRHRAAIGISEQTDAVVIVVSEETGSISLVVRGRIERNLTEEQLRRRIFSLIRPQAPRRAVPFMRRSIDRAPTRCDAEMGILLRNWHLKLSAVLLATVLYTGLVFSGSFSEDRLSVRLEGVNEPSSSIVVSGDLGLVEVEYRTANNLAITIDDQAFAASVDLSKYDMERAPEPQILDVQVRSLFEGVSVQSFQPETLRVAIDRIDVKTVPVEVDLGTIPEGFEHDEPVLSDEEAQVRGAASIVSQVDRAAALVSISASAIDINEPVNLVAVDVQGQPIGAGLVDIEPETVSVQIDVRETETTQAVPIRPEIVGTPAPGFALTSLGVEPATVTLRGLPGALAGVDEVVTEPLSIDGVSEDQSFEAQLVLPEDTRLDDESDEPVATVTATIVPSVSSRTFVVGVVCAGSGVNACLPAIDQLTITLSGPGGALSALSASELTPTVDASGLDPGTYNLTPTIGALPEGVELLDIAPVTVSVTIRAPVAPTPTPAP